jgi:hypothetical protein
MPRSPPCREDRRKDRRTGAKLREIKSYILDTGTYSASTHTRQVLSSCVPRRVAPLGSACASTATQGSLNSVKYGRGCVMTYRTHQPQPQPQPQPYEGAGTPDLGAYALQDSHAGASSKARPLVAPPSTSGAGAAVLAAAAAAREEVSWAWSTVNWMASTLGRLRR